MGIHGFGVFIDDKRHIVRYLKDINSLNLDLNSIIHDAAGLIYHYKLEDSEETVRLDLIEKLKTYSKKDFKKVKPSPSPETVDRILNAINSGNFSEFSTVELFNVSNQKTDKDLEKEHIKEIEKKIFKLYKELSPKNLIVAVDGLAPAAKIVQQRQRRYKPKSGSIFDSNCITPGTEFMLRLHLQLSEFLKSKKFNCNVIYSGYNIPGEGEHKIMEMYRTGKHSPKGKHVIYGLDWDLVVLCLLSNFEESYLFKGSYNFFNSKDKSTVRNNFISINALRESYMPYLKSIEDFAVLVSLVGNDFLPRNPAYSVENLDKVLSVYKQIDLPLIVNGEIDLKVFGMVLNGTRELLEEQSKVEYIYPDYVFKNFTYENFKNEWYSRALNPLTTNLDLLKLSKPLWDDRINSKKQMAIEYLKGVNWILKYYTGKKCSKSWFYPFLYSPENDNILENINEKLIFQPEIEINMIDQLLTVIPPRSEDLLKKIKYNKLQVQWLMPEFCHSRLEGANKEYEEKLLVPFPNFELLKKVTKSITLQEQYAPGTLITNANTIGTKEEFKKLNSRFDITLLKKAGFEFNPIVPQKQEKRSESFAERKSDPKKEKYEFEFSFFPELYDYYSKYVSTDLVKKKSNNMTYLISGYSGLVQDELEKILITEGYTKSNGKKADLIFLYHENRDKLWYDPEIKNLNCKYKNLLNGLSKITNKKTLHNLLSGTGIVSDSLNLDEITDITEPLILKPVGGFSGKDIIIVESMDELKIAKEKLFQFKEITVSKYIKDVLLFNGKKFHLRIYIFVKYPKFKYTVCTIGRINTAKIEYKKEDYFNNDIHVTNSTSTDGDYYFPGDLIQELKDYNNPEEIVNELFSKIENKISSAMELVSKNIKKFPEVSDFGFHVLGADILVTENLEPIILEINDHVGYGSKLTTDIVNGPWSDTYREYSKEYYTQLYNFVFKN